jgi:glycine cleavage system H lipoate-binding protein
MKGKHKQNAKILHVDQPFCQIMCKNTIYSCINAKLIEVNEKVIKNPGLFQDKSQSDGYLIILYPKIDKIMDQFTSLIPHEEFVKICNNRNSENNLDMSMTN